jgi:alkaline phosphatase D
MKRLTAAIFHMVFNTVWSQLPSHIAFGSCGHQDKPLEIFKAIDQNKPNLFIFLGDNIYGDTEDMRILKKKYRKLKNNRNFSQLKKHATILATWDDHDYGENDAGKYYPKKETSKKVFLKFFKEPRNSPRRKHPGIYTSYFFEENSKVLQIILLDCRTFRSNLLPYDGSLKGDSTHSYAMDYSAYPPTSDSTLLGAEQWSWLREELKKPADLRIICTSTQFATEYNGYESWANFPGEQQRMIELIKETRANGVFFISGDVHYAELSRRTYPGMYPIYDLTSSGLTEEWKFSAPNTFRMGNPVMENHFGFIHLDWIENSIKLEIRNVDNAVKLSYSLNLNELKF